MNKNIIFIINYFGNGGAATVMKILIEELRKDGYNIKLVVFLDDSKKYPIPDKVDYIIIKEKAKIKSIFQLRKILKKYSRSIVISFEYFINLKVIMANMFLKNKLIVSERNDPNTRGNNIKGIRNFLYRFSNMLVCQTEDAKEYFPKYIKNKTVVIPNPVRDDLPKRFVGERNKNIVNFCRIEKQKNLPMLIDAFEIVLQKYPEYRLVIYGDGSEKNNIKQYIINKKLDEYIKLEEFTQNLHEKIKNFAMFVSSSNYEGISNSMLEAMAIGLPTICTDCPCGRCKNGNRKWG